MWLGNIIAGIYRYQIDLSNGRLYPFNFLPFLFIIRWAWYFDPQLYVCMSIIMCFSTKTIHVKIDSTELDNNDRSGGCTYGKDQNVDRWKNVTLEFETLVN